MPARKGWGRGSVPASFHKKVFGRTRLIFAWNWQDALQGGQWALLTLEVLQPAGLCGSSTSVLRL